MQPSVQSGSELKKIFDAFDLDKSGSIELKELKSVAAQLGKEIGPEQLTSIIKKLDSNKDGKISYGEFEYWWQKGMEGKMMQLVYLRSKAMKLTNFVKKKAATLGINFEGHKGKQKPDKYSIKLNFGAQTNKAISIDFGIYVKGQKEVQLREKIKKYAPDTTTNTFGIIMRLPSKNPAKAKAAMDHMFNSILANEQLPIEIESMEQNPLFKTKTVVSENDLIVRMKLEPELQNAVAPVSTSVEHVISQIGQGFYSQADFHFSLNSSFDQLLSDTILTNILRGFNLSFVLEANNSALQKLRKFAEKNKIETHPYFNLVTLFRTAKFHLSIKSPQHLTAFFKKLGVDDIVGGLPGLKDLLQELTPIAKEGKQNSLAMRLIYKLSRFAFEHVENDVELYFLGGDLGVGYLRVQGKNASKLHSVIFNEN